MFVSFLLFAT